MRTFVVRRLTLLTFLVFVALAVSIVMLSYHLRLHATVIGSGWLLLALLLFLAGYNLRKKLRLFPLLPTAWWLQAHIYVGLLTVVVYLWHTGGRVPGGAMHISLASVFGLVLGTGLIGIWLSRVVPRWLTVRGQEVIYERIPVLRRELNERAEQLVLQVVDESQSTALADFYQRELQWFFAAPRHRWTHLYQSTKPLRRLLTQLQSMRSYANEREIAHLEELEELVRRKDVLDYHLVMQGLLKGWLFVHVPLTWVLLLLIALHVVVVYAYSGAL